MNNVVKFKTKTGSVSFSSEYKEKYLVTPHGPRAINYLVFSVNRRPQYNPSKEWQSLPKR